MAKKKEVEIAAFEDKAETVGLEQPVVEEVVIAEVDFNELLELEKATRQTEEQFNKIAGSIERLKRDLDAYHNHEKSLNEQINVKRKDLVRRNKIDDSRQWRIDINTRKVVYQG